MPLPQRVLIRARVRGRQAIWCHVRTGWSSAPPNTKHRRDTAPVVSGVRDLLDDACTVLPALGEYELAEV